MRLEPGASYPLGATWDGSGTNFTLFSAHAEKVELCLFDHSGRREIARIALPENTHEVWHGYLPDVRPGQLYGYRVYGPFEPANGHRFNPHKLLIDPYAKALHGTLRWHDAVFGYRVGHARDDLSFDRRDSAFVMPKCVVIDPAVTWGDDKRPMRRWRDTVIYEAHVKGFTAIHPNLPERVRGTFAGLADPHAIDQLVKLGVTAVELMAVHAFIDDRNLVDHGLRNYWGYNSFCFFAPDVRYLSPGADVHEFKLMVRRLHEAGIEVLLDVVYNHTAEGNQMGPTLSFRGIDNASYYKLAEDRRFYFDTTGCGNTLSFTHPRVLQMVMDSLRYWVQECHVDGFRFDLAVAHGRDHGGAFNPSATFFDAVRQDPVLSRVKLIAEPWDLGPEGYRLGGFPPGWAEWNGKYRDDVRSFWRGDEGTLPAFAGGLLGSAYLFARRGRKPWASVNFVTAHDGFTLADLTAYNDKHNEANQEGNRDGHNDNRSFNCGVEGPTDDPAILALRDRMRRNFLATLLLSQGTPMLLMGDEVARTQLGNNNAYCQDNEISWVDWVDRGPRARGLRTFTRDLVALRRRLSVLRQEQFLHGERIDANTRNVRWLHPEGREMTESDWIVADARAVALKLAARGGHRMLLLFNANATAVTFALDERLEGFDWWEVLSTAAGTVARDAIGVGRAWPLTVEERSVVALVGRAR